MISSKFARPIAWLLLVAIIFVTLSPIALRPHTVTSVNLDRALAYSLVGFMFAIAYPRQWIAVAFLLVAGALAIEYLQYLSPTRHARLHDAAVKILGASVGVSIGCLLNKIRIIKSAASPSRP
ncbi:MULTISPECIES: VanZ family protein [unclassified Rhizobium]|uniref:VanZ family protein n=1 Tax=unclassified Rhizobium TaxID=2613769 RepID=UPI00160FF8F7|nr:MULTISPECIES: VanZ family protein [unclassified Rhizobium]MBB3543550.1 VanZ family protein [Rhizobium sp. BK399]MCS3741790.1 VanZ family protein [Rhizobium sp. BK661]MCS4095369.1 VanZ family protein [Rhizobium sp. BK176]